MTSITSCIKMTITQADFGVTSKGQSVSLFTLTNNTVTVKISTFGATIVSIQVPDKNKKISDVVLGFDSVKGYEAKNPYFGATVGRVSGRIGQGKFTLNGESYQLAINNGPNHLHGGLEGFDKKIFQASVQNDSLQLVYVSPDGEEGYPGEVTLTVTYTLRDDNGLVVDYHATSNQPTPISLTNHSYFNLAGHEAGSINDHLLQILADEYAESDLKTLLNSGRLIPVTDSIFDLRQRLVIGERIHDIPGGGFDVSFKHPNQSLDYVCARVEHPDSGRVLEVMTNQPAVHLYTGNFLDASLTGKQGHSYPKHSALCLEMQNFPNAINLPSFPNCVLKPGEAYRSTTIYKFSVSS
ncbi:galactose mutarotase-like isoform X2 [Apostichopus japonicus]|uniref:galactose mutarotase-like isoform X2 n=1 Tax=Stichopus japonicus TaxID=307972 RepID=UPI003AB6AF06